MSFSRWAALPLFLGIVLAPWAARAQVVGWRGDTSGKYLSAAPPVQWSAKPPKNIGWTQTVGQSYSCPVVCGNRILLTSEPDKLLCLDKATGKILWQKRNGFSELPAELQDKDQKLATSCGYTTPTPVTDGKFIYAFFGTGIVACYDMDGNRKWIKFLEMESTSPYGRSASPVLAGDKLIIPISCMMALDAATGNVAWKQEKADATYGSPIGVTIGKLWVILSPNGDILRASDGAILAKDLGIITYTAPIFENGIAYYIDAQSYALSITPKGDNDIETRKVWEESVDGSEFFATPVLHDGLIYVIDKQAEYSVLDATTGKAVFHQVLKDLPPGGEGNDEGPQVWPSVSLAGKGIYLCNNKGDTLVIEPGQQYKLISRNKLSDGSASTATFDGKQMFVRGGLKLYSIQAD